jgi:outer membrane protein OmpA-like peptidoglycan-associated protein
MSEKEVRAIGCGESRPVAPNTSAANKAKNRRVEIVVHMR